MARGTQLLQLVDDLRAEVGHSLNPAQGTNLEQTLKKRLRSAQSILYDEYDWPFLRIRPVVSMSAGARFYDFPSDLNLERVETVSRWFGGIVSPIARGIDLALFNSVNSEDGVRRDPVEHWDVIWTGTTEQIEIWPIPATNGKIQFVGIRNLRPLISNSDVADLDDDLIVLTASVNILARQKNADAQISLATAQQRLRTLKSRLKGASRSIVIGGGGPEEGRRRTLVVQVADSSP